MCLVAKVNGVDPDEVQLETGVMVQEAGQFQPTQQEWHHVYAIDFPQAADLPIAEIRQIGISNDTYIRFLHDGAKTRISRLSSGLGDMMAVLEQTVNRQINDLLNSTHSDLADLSLLIQSTVPEHINITRRKRGLDFLGQAIGWIAGMPTNADMNKLKDTISDFVGQQQALNYATTTKIDKLLTVEKLLNERITNTTKQWFKTMQSALSETHTFSANIMDSVVGLSHYTYLITGHLTAKSKVDSLIRNFRSAVVQLQGSHLSPTLVSEDRLQATLDSIQAMLSRDHPGYYLMHSQSAYYYSAAKVLAWRESNRVLVELSIPIAHKARTFKVFRLRPLQIPLHSNLSMTTQVTNLPVYLAVDNEAEQFAELATADFLMCQDGDLSDCLRQVPIMSFSTPSCSLALYQKNSHLIKSLCKVDIATGSPPEQAREIVPGKLLIINAPQKSLLCNDGTVKTLPGCSICTFTVPCDCDVVVNGLRFSQQLEHCAEVAETKEVVNLHLISRLWSDTVLSDTISKVELQRVYMKANDTLRRLADTLSDGQDLWKEGRVEIEKALAEAAAVQVDQPILKRLTWHDVQPGFLGSTSIVAWVSLALTLYFNILVPRMRRGNEARGGDVVNVELGKVTAEPSAQPERHNPVLPLGQLALLQAQPAPVASLQSTVSRGTVAPLARRTPLTEPLGKLVIS